MVKIKLKGRPFNTTFKFPAKDGVVLINGAQIVKIDSYKVDGKWQVTLHLSDGSSYVLGEAGSEYFYTTYMETDPEL